MQHSDRDRTLLVVVAGGVTVLAVVLLTWWIVDAKSRALEHELGLTRHETAQQLGTIEDDLATLDGRLGEVPGPLDRQPAEAAPPVIVPVPTPSPAPAPAPPSEHGNAPGDDAGALTTPP